MRVKTLGIEADVTRAALYSTYVHLEEEFERRRAELREAGVVTDPRDARIARLEEVIEKLRARIIEQDNVIAEHTSFWIQAVSQLAAEHDEIVRLRAALADDATNVTSLPRQAS
ncbi:hypothetical protein ACIHDR_24370 [Nocardia sp. NPDC052278]|uniref:hypothetical protein n=1 Tax=unclassified Nocardia TaxID=2637762 RepID=UPI0036830F95